MKKEFNIGDLVMHVGTTTGGYIMGKNDLTYKILWFDQPGMISIYSVSILRQCIDSGHWIHRSIISENK